MIRCPDNQINTSFIGISRIKWLVFLLWSSFFHTTSTVASSEAQADYQTAPGRTDGVPERHQRQWIINPSLCLELQQNRSWIKGLGKNPQKSELIHWRQCLLSVGTEACSLGLRENTGMYTRHPTFVTATSGVLTPASGKTLKKRNACLHAVQQAVENKIACIYGLRSEGVNKKKTVKMHSDYFHVYVD